MCRDIVMECFNFQGYNEIGKLIVGIVSRSFSFCAITIYYPPCPGQELTYHIGDLQVVRKIHWIDVPRTPCALVANIGVLLQAYSHVRSRLRFEASLSSSVRKLSDSSRH
ncbi:1-aminocyclopropane-1-carboxylate oxidase homolog 3-like [Mercurialis annua]|uniref:1-aminocyclopropane-1-carboxylate oxidase homolog 3-like n=1 Tax=Mercurialis annua TaxID=3986 RepID=UPI0024AD5BC3|nr:1-aminocyclopropane-1-carboxylate oxidase homolog 3-like [Mercurialis annua]